MRRRWPCRPFAAALARQLISLSGPWPVHVRDLDALDRGVIAGTSTAGMRRSPLERKERITIEAVIRAISDQHLVRVDLGFRQPPHLLAAGTGAAHQPDTWRAP